MLNKQPHKYAYYNKVSDLYKTPEKMDNDFSLIILGEIQSCLKLNGLKISNKKKMYLLHFISYSEPKLNSIIGFLNSQKFPSFKVFVPCKLFTY